MGSVWTVKTLHKWDMCVAALELAGIQALRHPFSAHTRLLQQYAGTLTGASPPMQSLPTASGPLSALVGMPGYKETAFPANPAIPLADQAMATGQAPSDIARVRWKGWLHGKIMGQRVNAQGRAAADVGNNDQGGITGVCCAKGAFCTDGPLGCMEGLGEARAAAATTSETDPAGSTIVNGAACARASGCLHGALPDGRGFYARGSANAEAEGTVVYTGRTPY